ncbi:MAG: hypothetical protein LUI85_21745 [Bacteroides sp.]|nr:hypothetical protein [Bacteroides sp.]
MKKSIKDKLNSYIKKSHWYNEVLFKNCQQFWNLTNQNIDVVNLGSSSGTFAFDYSSVGLRGENWAIAPQTIVGDFLILKQFRHYLKEDATVLYPICPFTAISGAVDYIEDRCYSFLDYETIPNGHYIRNVRVLEQMNDPLLFYPAVEVLRDIKFHLFKKSEKLMSESELEKNAENWIRSWTEQFHIDDLNNHFIADHSEVYHRTVALLNEMIDYCHEEHLNLVIVVPPVHHSLGKKFTLSAKGQLLDSLKNDANLQKVKFLNYMDESSFAHDASLFQNSYFLNKKGACKFTQYLLTILKLL